MTLTHNENMGLYEIAIDKSGIKMYICDDVAIA